jgi:hypothetical protein
MRGTLGETGRMFGLLQQTGDPMIELIGPVRVYAGDTTTLRLTITDDADARVDLTGAELELEVKQALGGADPALISKSVGAGITLLDQTDTVTRGQADIELTSADTAQAPGLYWLDVVVALAGARVHVVAPREFTVAAVVNAA